MSRCCTRAAVGIVGALSLHSPSLALAQDTTWYQIEVVIFANRDTASGASEAWPNDPGSPALESPVELASSTTALSVDTEAAGSTTSPIDTLPPETTSDSAAPSVATPSSGAAQTLDVDESLGLRAFVRLPEEELQLVKLRDRLDSSPGYRTLAHVGWRQPLSRQEKPRLVHVSSNRRRKALPLMTAPMSTPDPSLNDEAVATAEPQMPLLTLDGTVSVALGRYLHVDVDLVYAPDEPSVLGAPNGSITPSAQETTGPVDGTGTADTPSVASPPPPAVAVYRLVQSRRMRSNELHYLDHPLFGVLVQATPVKLGRP